MAIEGIVYDGANPAPVQAWCERQVGRGRCNFSWTMRGWHVTVATTYGHELLREGDAVIRVGDDSLGIVRKEER